MYNCPCEGHFDLLKVVFLIYILEGVAHKIKTRGNKNYFICSFRCLIPERMTPTLFRSI